MDLEEWKKLENESMKEIISKTIKKIEDGKKISILDLLRDDFRKGLEGKEYRPWFPPLKMEMVKQRPKFNLATCLISLKSDVILAPLNAYSNKAEFTYRYGLSKNLGITYDKFLELIREGKIWLFLTGSPTFYKAEFYKEIFNACKKQGYIPQFTTYLISRFMGEEKIASISKAKGIPFEEACKNHPEYSYENTEETTKKLIDKKSVEELSKILHYDVETTLCEIATRLFLLRTFGFEQLASLSQKIIQREKILGYHVLNYYTKYLIEPCNAALFSQMTYDFIDLKRMAFLRLPRLSNVGNLLSYCPANLRTTIGSLDENIILKADSNEVTTFLKKYENKEIKENTAKFVKSSNQYDFDMVLKSYKKLSEIIEEKYNKELKDWFKRSKIAKVTAYLGIGFTAAVGVYYAYRHFPNLTEKILSYLPKKELIDEYRVTAEKLSDVLVKKWPFAEKGLPFIMWEYGIKRV